ncbi:Cerebroside-sulfatase [Planctomycetales bacterium 10988]|nr:Cerebroside-sulfatase [Planctomycetales bacterium 10988]
MQRIFRRSPHAGHLRVLASSLLLLGLAAVPESNRAAERPEIEKPNFIMIYCDDLGYGDLGCFGSKKHRTPNIDRLAEEGMKFTDFHVTSGVCTPSRSSLMTGCYPQRVDMHENQEGRHVFFPGDAKGLNPQETTVADILKKAGYTTACVGKWHMGDQLPFLPTEHGFDEYFGIPFSNDMGQTARPDLKYPPLPLVQNKKVIEEEPDQAQLTKRYTEVASKFIREHQDEPFLLYLPHTFPHWPLYASEQFAGKSANGDYGDAIEELDWSTGELMKLLEKLDLTEKTLIVFSSDNGAANRHGGSNDPLRGHKGSTFEGGMRVPMIARWPGQVPAGTTCDQLCGTIDILPTFAKLAGEESPQDVKIDGTDIWPQLAGDKEAKQPHRFYLYYKVRDLQAVRRGPWKLFLKQGELYNLKRDRIESTDVAEDHPEIVEQLHKLADRYRERLGDLERQGSEKRPAAMVDNPKPLTSG